jgi:hypothetical protein
VSGARNEVRVIDSDDTIAGGYVRRYLESTPALADRLIATGIAVVVFTAEDVRHETELTPDYFDKLQAALSVAAGHHGPALYVASVHARPLLRSAKPLPALDALRGAFIGYFAYGEGGAVFIQPSGQLGSDAALFDAAISAMMARHR